MRTPNPANLAMVTKVAARLGTLRDSVVFVGGSVVDLLITDPAAPTVQSTTDVDVIVEVASQLDYHRLGDRLRTLGFREDSQSEGGPVCRWIIDGITVDTMPMKGQVLGFSNDYYTAAVKTAVTIEIAEGLAIRLISAPCFLATKLEAFKDRGRCDFMASPDMEDIIAVLDGRPEIVKEIENSPLEVKSFLVNEFAALLDDDQFQDCLQGHLEFDSGSPERVSLFVERLGTIAAMS
jgi:predicted nucleotidyltransferase